MHAATALQGVSLWRRVGRVGCSVAMNIELGMGIMMRKTAGICAILLSLSGMNPLDSFEAFKSLVHSETLGALRSGDVEKI
jgi:hypothetical protein